MTKEIRDVTRDKKLWRTFFISPGDPLPNELPPRVTPSPGDLLLNELPPQVTSAPSPGDLLPQVTSLPNELPPQVTSLPR